MFLVTILELRERGEGEGGKYNKFMYIWYVPHRRATNAQISLRFRTVPPEPSWLAHIK